VYVIETRNYCLSYVGEKLILWRPTLLTESAPVKVRWIYNSEGAFRAIEEAKYSIFAEYLASSVFYSPCKCTFTHNDDGSD
jgi:hypothetical protein